MTSKQISDIFNQHIVDKECFLKNPRDILKKNLMIKINGKIYDKKIGVPQLISLMCFNSALTTESLEKLLFDQRITQKTFTIQTKLPPEELWDHIKLRQGLNSLEFTFKGNFN